jgi:hypothetical protein
VPRRRLGEVERGAQVYLYHVLPVLLAELQRGARRMMPGVVDENVEAPQLGDALADDVRGVFALVSRG